MCKKKLVKKLKTNIKIIIGVAIGILISVASCYVLAETLINSKDVVYEDNSGLAAENVQDAIDGTCSKIDTRLANIEDKLYTVKNLYVTDEIVPPTDISYTGLYVVIPANSYCSVTAGAYFNYTPPTMIVLSSSSATSQYSLAVMDGFYGSDAAYSTVTYSTHTIKEMTIYLWAKYYENNSRNNVTIDGFCATKYK